MSRLTDVVTNGLFGASSTNIIMPIELVISTGGQTYYQTIEMVQKEANTVQFTLTDANGTAVDVSTATLTLYGKNLLDETVTGYVFEKADVSFTKSVGGDDNVVSVALDDTDMDFDGSVFAILKCVIAGTNIKKGIFRIVTKASPE